LYGSGNPHVDLPRSLKLYEQGLLKIDHMISKVYPLEEINQAFDDMVTGKNVRSVIQFRSHMQTRCPWP
jgi:S-(hydroxymethyl)glutathione dehydrogenase/alcohol dehydrogenase